MFKMELLIPLVLISLQILVSVVTESWPDPPKWEKKAEMARYLMHYADWGIVSAISPQFGLAPFGTLQSFADGTMDTSTGIPYFYIANVSDTYKNLHYNNTATVTVSMAESDYCQNRQLDPEEPLCARGSLLGKVVVVDDPKEAAFAKKALFNRHPAMAGWPTDHGWDFYKLEPSAVYLLDFYGGATHVPLKDYFAAKPGMN